MEGEQPEHFRQKGNESPAEEERLFDEAVKQATAHERAKKLLFLIEHGRLPSSDELDTADFHHALDSLRKRYPTFKDLELGLKEIVASRIGVAPRKEWSRDEYQQAAQEKKRQYVTDAVFPICRALYPVYQECGAASSEENKERILKNFTAIENFTDFAGKIDPESATDAMRAYVEANILAAAKQDLSPEEAQAILQAQQAFFEVWSRVSPNNPLRPELESAIKEIEKKSAGAASENAEPRGEKEHAGELVLKGESTEITYPGKPLHIYLADKHLTVIDVRDNPKWNAEYLLIDPETFRSDNPSTGYKGIRKNEPVILGRGFPSRFNFPGTVSRTHLKIVLKDDDTFLIEDLGSTNGTTIRYGSSASAGAEQEAHEEASPEKERTIAEFRKYVERHRDEIEQELSEGISLSDIFYHEFYSTDIDRIKYAFEDPAVKKLQQEYTASVNAVGKELQRFSESGAALALHDSGYWLFCNVNGSFPRGASLGRLYFNLKPEFVPRFFAEAAKALQKNGVRCQMKIPAWGDVIAFNRFDKMVLYFDAQQEREVLRTLDTLYRRNAEAFEEEVPRFTVAVRDENGERMAGVGFGEDPPFRKASFGDIRAHILAEVYREAKKLSLSVSDPRFDFESSFRRACRQYHVDPQNPAFNLPRNPGKFSEIKQRMRVAKGA